MEENYKTMMPQFEALHILRQYQRWRRGMKPYDSDDFDNYRLLEYDSKEIGMALDWGIHALEKLCQTDE